MEGPVPSEPESLSLADCERRHILRVLEHSGWVIRGPRGAAALLGMAASSLRDRMRKLGITRPSR
jgi:transcriptional regulator with GAF, ATPase, and Fis domain